MMAFLTQTGKVRPSLASSLIDQGLDDPSKLRAMERDDLLEFKGVGERTAEVLLELKAIAQAQAPADTMWDALKREKVRANVLQSLKDAGLDSPGKIKEAGIEGLVKLKGIGEPTARRILDSVKDLPEPAKASIEDASAVQAPEEAPAQPPAPQKGPGFMDKVTAFFKGLFGKKAEEGPKEAPAESPPAAPPAEAPAPEAPPAAEATEAAAADGPAAPEAKLEADGKGPEVQPAAEAKAEEVPAPETPAPAPEGGTSAPGPQDQAPPAAEGKEGPSPQPSVPEEPAKQGFFDKILSMFKKQPAPAQPAAPSAESEKTAEPVPEASSAPASAEDGPKEGAAPPAGSGGPEQAKIESIEGIPGIKPEIAKKLMDAGYQNLDELREAVPEDLVLIPGIDLQTAQMICSALIEKA